MRKSGKELVFELFRLSDQMVPSLAQDASEGLTTKSGVYACHPAKQKTLGDEGLSRENVGGILCQEALLGEGGIQ